MSSSTIISNSGALFAYLFNVAAGSERFTKTKTVGVFFALLGAVMVGIFLYVNLVENETTVALHYSTRVNL